MASAIIRTERLKKSYNLQSGAVQALRGITLEIAEAEFVAVMGASGSGKSTLLHLLGLLDRPSSGRYLLGDQDVGHLNPNARALIRNRKVGFVFQSFNLLARNTAIENVELPLVYMGMRKSERRRHAAKVLESVGLVHRRDHWPHQLSGGEQQRVAIARAIVNDPLLILADEPTGALDTRNGSAILAILQALNRAGRTIVLVTHDRNVARYAGRIITLRDGTVVADDRVVAPFDALFDLSGGQRRGTQDVRPHVAARA